MQRRFVSDPLFQATLLLLQERIPKSARCSIRTPPSCPTSARPPAAPESPVRVLHQPRHADARSAAAVERPLPRHGHQRRRRLQPLEGPGRHPLARRRDLRQLGHLLLPPRRGERRRSGRPRYQPTLQRGRALRGDLHRGARRVPPPRPRYRDAHRDRRLARRRRRAAPACASPTARARAGRSR